MSSSEYSLKQPHNHAGTEHAKGEKLVVRDDLAARYPDVFERVATDAAPRGKIKE